MSRSPMRAIAVFRNKTPPMPVSARTTVRTSVWLRPSGKMPIAPATPQMLPMIPVQMAFEVHQGFKSSISVLQKKTRQKAGGCPAAQRGSGLVVA